MSLEIQKHFSLEQPLEARRSLYLHIGSEKTGTATLHKFLSLNSARLREQGFSYFDSNKLFYSGHSDSHSPIVASFFPEPPDFISPPEHVPNAKMLTELARELGREKRNVILSSEHFSSRLRSIEDIRRLRQALSSFHVYILFYSRPQYELYLSSYSTALINGRRDVLGYDDAALDEGYLDYGRLLSPWAEVFGKQNIIVRDYRRLLAGDICQDFISLLGLRDSSRFVRVRRTNESLTARSAEIIRRMNAYLPNRWDRAYGTYRFFIELRWLVHSMVARFVGGGRMSRPEIRSRIEARFAESNRKVSATYSHRIDRASRPALDEDAVQPDFSSAH